MNVVLLLLLSALSNNPSQEAYQDEGKWIIKFHLKNDTNETLDLDALQVKVEGWVSNSKGGHPKPILSTLEFGGVPASVNAPAIAPIPDNEEKDQIDDPEQEGPQPEEPGDQYLRPEPVTAKPVRNGILHTTKCILIKLKEDKYNPENCEEELKISSKSLHVGPNREFDLLLEISHLHVPYGPWHPLMGTRTIQLKCGSWQSIADVVKFDSVQEVYPPGIDFRKVPGDRKTDRFPKTIFLSRADEYAQRHYLSFEDMPVKYNTKMVLEFYYLFAPNSFGTFNIWLRESKDTPSSYKTLDRKFEFYLSPQKGPPQWRHFKEVYTINSEANIGCLTMRIADLDLETPEQGDIYIRDLTFKPLESRSESP